MNANIYSSLFSAVAASAVAAFALTFSVAEAGFQGAPVLLSITLGLAVYTLIRSIWHRRDSPLLFVMSVYMIFFYLAPGLIHVSTDAFPFYNPIYSEDAVLAAGFVVLIFWACFSIGYTVKARAVTRRIQIIRHQELPSAGYRNAALLCSIVSVAAALTIGYPILQIDRGEIVDVTEFGPIFQVLTTLARVGGFLALVYSFLLLRVQRKFLPLSLFLLAVFIFFSANSPAAVPRFLLGSYAIAFYLLFPPFSAAKKIVLLIALVLGQFTIFPALSGIARGDDRMFEVPNPFTYFSTSGDFDGFQSTVSVAEMVQGGGLAMGRQLASSALFFVPRALWPEKSIGTGGEAAQYMKFPFINLSAPLPAEMYADFGFLGVIILSFILGWFVSGVDRSFEEAARWRNMTALIPIALTSGYAFILMRGSLVGVLGPFVLSVGLTVLASRAFRRTGSA